MTKPKRIELSAEEMNSLLGRIEGLVRERGVRDPGEPERDRPDQRS